MKVFHTENVKEVVYVQMQDIMYLLNDKNDKIKVTKKGKIKITKIGYFFDIEK